LYASLYTFLRYFYGFWCAQRNEQLADNLVIVWTFYWESRNEEEVYKTLYLQQNTMQYWLSGFEMYKTIKVFKLPGITNIVKINTVWIIYLNKANQELLGTT
jgi:hypothetical protein